MFETTEWKPDMHAIRYAATTGKDINLIYGYGRKILLDSRTAKTMLEVYNLLDLRVAMYFEEMLENNPYELAVGCWKVKNHNSSSSLPNGLLKQVK